MEKTYPYPHRKGKIKWVSTSWLENHLEDKDLMILDVQPTVHDYIQGHIPGAFYMNEGLFHVTLKDQPAMYAPSKSIQAILSRIGLKNDLPVVVYTGVGSFECKGEGIEQAVMAYSLARFGHNKVYILDGGIEKWKKEGRYLTKVFPKVEKSDFVVEVCREYFIKHEEFKKIKDLEDVIVLDTRSAAIYEGQGPWIKPGHIPGAINLPWTTLMDEKNKSLLRLHEEIQSILEEHNITSDRTIICYCGTGRKATSVFIILKWYLYYPKVKIYEGSFTEWTSYPDNPTVTGKNPV